VASSSSTTPLSPRTQRVAKLLGAFNVLGSIALAVASAVGLSRIARHSLESGLVILSLVLVGRWLLVSLTDAWNAGAARKVKDFWRRQLTEHLRLPRSEGARSRGDLLLAIDHASNGPHLEQLSTSARASVLGLVVVFWAAGWLSTLITVVLMALAVPLYQRAGRRSEALAIDYQRRRGRLETRQLELLQHAPELRALGAVRYGADEIAALSSSEHSIAMRAIRVALESSLVTEFLSGVSIGLVSMVVGFSLLEGRISLEHALIAVLVTSDIFVNIRRFGVEFHRREEAERSMMSLSTRDSRMMSTNDDVLARVTNVVTTASPRVFDFDVVRGSRVLVTGASGSGKTTLLHTMLGWRTPVSGQVMLSTEPIGYVSVESSLFSGTLLDNLTLGANVGDNEVVEALASVGLQNSRFSNLGDYLLADGRGLSTGEKVRLVLVRSLLARPSLLILDDIGGVLDEPTRQSLRGLLSTRRDLAVIEATVDTPLLLAPFQEIQVTP